MSEKRIVGWNLYRYDKPILRNVSHNEAFIHVLKHSPFSFDYAIKWGGYRLEEVYGKEEEEDQYAEDDSNAG